MFEKQIRNLEAFAHKLVTHIAEGAHGKLSTSTQLIIPRGTSAIPSIQILDDSGTGIYSEGNDAVDIVVDGVDALRVTKSSGTIVDRSILQIQSGSASAGGICFVGDNDTGMFRAAANNIGFSTGGTERVRIDSSGNVGMGTTTFGTAAAKVLGIANGTEPSSSPADMAQIYSVDLSAGNATLGLRTETAVAADAALESTHSLTVRINGASYKIMLVSV